MRRVLFLHPNFPGQFRDQALDFAALGHDVRFLCQTHYGRSLKGVKRLCLKGELGHDALEAGSTNQLQRSQLQAEQYRRAMQQLEEAGWRPDVVISHSGWGCGLHVKQLWPGCHHVAYLEWWFAPDSQLFSHDPGNQELGLTPASAAKFWARNQLPALELVSADVVVAPTNWQRQQLPAALLARCQVIYDAVDTTRFKPNPSQRSPQPLITYGTRGMEPMRCFPQFIRELPGVLSHHPHARVQIAGLDEICYGGAKPPQGSWGRWAREKLQQWGLSDRVAWLGYMATDAYVRWLQSSWCHVYLTQPFVASWSLMEALECGCPLVASDVPPVRELCSGGSALLADHRQPGFLQVPVSKHLAAEPTKSIPCFPATANSEQTSLHRWRHVAGVEVATSG